MHTSHVCIPPFPPPSDPYDEIHCTGSPLSLSLSLSLPVSLSPAFQMLNILLYTMIYYWLTGHLKFILNVIHVF